MLVMYFCNLQSFTNILCPLQDQGPLGFSMTYKRPFIETIRDYGELEQMAVITVMSLSLTLL